MVNQQNETSESTSLALPDIQHLVQHEWNPLQIMYMLMIVAPMGRTEEEMAKELDRNRTTLWKWRQLDGFWTDVDVIANEIYKQKDYLIDECVTEMAVEGDLRAARLYYERRNLLQNRIDIAVTGKITITREIIDTIDAEIIDED